MFGKFPLFLLNLGKRNKINSIYCSTIVNFKANFYIYDTYIYKKNKNKKLVQNLIFHDSIDAKKIKIAETAMFKDFVKVL